MRGSLLRVAPAPALVWLLAACGGGAPSGSGERPEALSEAAPPARVPEVAPVFQTPRDTLDDIDSPAVWHGPDGEHWLLATAKATDVIVVADAATGEVIRRVGGSGVGGGELERPNGIAVADGLVWVVERDNARVQVLRLPGFQPLGTYGEGELRRPYGIAVTRSENNEYTTFVTDDYELTEDVIPPDSLLGERVRAYRVSFAADALSASLVSSFGATSGRGVLHVVESIAYDPADGRLLIAEEEEGASSVKVYDLEGRFSGDILDSEFFPNQAEGIALYACGDGEGYWIATDQGRAENTFHVFDRQTLEHVGAFRGRSVLNTDGITLSQESFGPFEAGAFYAVNDDGNVAAFDWSDIADALGLRANCLMPGGVSGLQNAGPAPLAQMTNAPASHPSGPRGRVAP